MFPFSQTEHVLHPIQCIYLDYRACVRTLVFEGIISIICPPRDADHCEIWLQLPLNAIYFFMKCGHRLLYNFWIRPFSSCPLRPWANVMSGEIQSMTELCRNDRRGQHCTERDGLGHEGQDRKGTEIKLKDGNVRSKDRTRHGHRTGQFRIMQNNEWTHDRISH